MRMLRKAAYYAPSVTFWGAAQSVSGSMHIVEWADERILLDCGLVLGWSAEAKRRNRIFPFTPASLTAVILSHAHIDHCGNLPNLVRQGFDGPILCTPATRDLVEIMLADSARIQEEEDHVATILCGSEEAAAAALYNARDIRRTLSQCVSLDYDVPYELRPGVQVRFADAGHLLGSAMTSLTLDGPRGECRITYTGDLGRRSLGFLRPPSPMPAADLIICESTYGGRSHEPLDVLSARLKQVVTMTIERGGKVLVPAFSLGRAQLVVHYLQQWMADGTLPRVPIFVDSALAADIATVYDFYPEGLMGQDSDVRRLESGVDPTLTPTPTRNPDPNLIPNPILTSRPLVHYIRNPRESRELSRRREPCIIVASGGMCEAGRIVNHFEECLDDPRCSVLLVSHQAPGSLGRKLLERGPTVHFRGKRWNKWADIVDVSGFSGHADQADFMDYFRPHLESSPRIRLVHGEISQAEALAASLRQAGFAEVEVPRREETVRVA